MPIETAQTRLKCSDCGKRDAIDRCEWPTKAGVRVGAMCKTWLCEVCVRGQSERDFLLLGVPVVAMPDIERAELLPTLSSFTQTYYHERRHSRKLWVCDAHFNLAFKQHALGGVRGGETARPFETPRD